MLYLENFQQYQWLKRMVYGKHGILTELISLLNNTIISIWSIDEIPTSTATQGQSEAGSHDNERDHQSPQSFRTEGSPSNVV